VPYAMTKSCLAVTNMKPRRYHLYTTYLPEAEYVVTTGTIQQTMLMDSG